MIDIEIGFVSGLKAEESVTEDFLAPLDNVQTPVSGITERNAFRTRVSFQKGVVKLEPTEEPIDVDQ